MSTIDLTDKQFEEVQRAVMRSAIRDLEHVGTELRRLEEAASWPRGTQSSDAQGAVRLLRESLDVLDAVGWPRDETREEWEARMNTATGETSTC